MEDQQELATQKEEINQEEAGGKKNKEIKKNNNPKSFRILDDTSNMFKDFAKEMGMTHEEAFNILMNKHHIQHLEEISPEYKERYLVFLKLISQIAEHYLTALNLSDKHNLIFHSIHEKKGNTEKTTNNSEIPQPPQISQLQPPPFPPYFTGYTKLPPQTSQPPPPPPYFTEYTKLQAKMQELETQIVKLEAENKALSEKNESIIVQLRVAQENQAEQTNYVSIEEELNTVKTELRNYKLDIPDDLQYANVKYFWNALIRSKIIGFGEETIQKIKNLFETGYIKYIPPAESNPNPNIETFCIYIEKQPQ